MSSEELDLALEAIVQSGGDRTASDLDVAKLGEEAIKNSPDTKKPFLLNNLGNACHTRFEQLGLLPDLERAIAFQQQAVDLTGDGDMAKPSLLNDLGISLQHRFQRLGELADINKAIDILSCAVDSTPDGDYNKGTWLINLGLALQTRFDCIGKLPDVERAIDFMQQALSLIPDGHADKPAQFNNLGIALQSRFKRHGELADVQQAIAFLQQAVELTADENTRKPAHLNNLGNAFQSRFELLGELSDLDKAISCMQHAVKLTPDGRTDKSIWINNLGIYFHSRFEFSKECSDLDKAIDFKKQAVKLTPDDHIGKPTRLTTLGDALQSRFEQLNEPQDLEQAIYFIQQAIDLTPDLNGKKPRWLTNLGISFWSRFHHFREPADLDKSISAHQQALEFTLDDSPNRPALFTNLGLSLKTRFQCFGDIKDVTKAIAAFQQAADCTTESDLNKATSFTSLGLALQIQFQHLGKLADIDRAIGAYQKAVELTLADRFQKSVRLTALGTCFENRFRHSGELTDIEQAIDAYQKTVKYTLDGDSNKPAYLTNFGLALQRRYEHLGEFTDLEKSISAHHCAVNIATDHIGKHLFLNNLGISLLSRYERLGELADLAEAIGLMEQAVGLTPDGHAGKAAQLSNLGLALQRRFVRLKELSDVDQGIRFLQQAVKLGRGSSLNSLGQAFLSRFEHLGVLTDLDHAIRFLQQAVHLTSETVHASSFHNLGTAHLRRFERFNAPDDLNQAIVFMQQAVELTPDGHATKALRLNTLGKVVQLRFEHLADSSDRLHALNAFRAASIASHGDPYFQLDSAIQWASLCSDPDLALQAYERLFQLIPQVVWLGKTVGRRYEELLEIGHAVNEAVAMAISVGNFARAIEWVETGRGVVWGQIIQLRSPSDLLQRQHPDIAEKLEEIARGLENARAASWSKSSSPYTVALSSTGEREAHIHSKLAGNYDKLVKEIRDLEGFGSFLKPKQLSDLAPAACNSPVIILTYTGAIALLPPHADILYIPLPSLSKKQCQELHSKLTSSLTDLNVCVGRNGDRLKPKTTARHSENIGTKEFQSILAVLWLNVVEPILSALGLLHRNSNNYLSHITWCATGTLAFLPLHAAGIYGSADSEQSVKTSDFVVSSYTTTLGALINSGLKSQGNLIQKPRVLIISQPETPDMPPLPGTCEEAELIQQYTFPDDTLHLSHDKATVEAVMKEMSKHEIVHLACHGIQESSNPLDSSFALYDGALQLKALMGLSLHNTKLAVLSACQTATGEETLPEEAVHLAAGMLTVGYPSVIATMWSIEDEVAPRVIAELYARLFGKKWNHGDREKRKVYLGSAYALHEAVNLLREEVGEMNFVKWVPFVHFGADSSVPFNNGP
ncbi:TPR-like protein [Rhodocollybia butyracea]|uniref:TPR-like protein n=1 Tax=Rhodocollybia butyracea TaxID=206335 RepID=A0A9P5P9K3_9AGAR|nr:TPR-like protein [Rhodocollybia butyracea]